MTITCYMTIKRVSYVIPRIEYVSVLGCCDLLTSREDTLRCATYSFGTITDIDGDSMQPRGDGIVTISMVSGSMYTRVYWRFVGYECESGSGSVQDISVINPSCNSDVAPLTPRSPLSTPDLFHYDTHCPSLTIRFGSNRAIVLDDC